MQAGTVTEFVEEEEKPCPLIITRFQFTSRKWELVPSMAAGKDPIRQ